MAIIDFRRLGNIGIRGSWECGACGSVVTSPETHQIFHDNINKIFASFSNYIQEHAVGTSGPYTFDEVRIIGGGTILIPVKLPKVRIRKEQSE